MDIKELQKNWNRLGAKDPFRAIIFLFYRKKWTKDEFWRLGIEQVNRLIKYIESPKVNIQRRKALDFGCGIRNPLLIILMKYMGLISPPP